MRDLPGFRHALGVHCASAALRNVVLFHTGMKWSEALCFGLSSGLNFTYVREPGSPVFLVMGRGSYMESHFCDALEIRLVATYSDEPDVAWAHLRGVIDAGELALLDTDMFHLPYMVEALGLPEGIHFGGHKVLAMGYDPVEGTVEVADYAWSSRKRLSIEQLALARDSRQCPARPRNACFRFRFPDRLPMMADAIQVALQTFASQMTHPFKPFNGLPAIDRFCRQVPRWKQTLPEQELLENTALAAFMLEKAGTGGGGFRNLYSRFLREAGDITGSQALAAAAACYRQLADHWREVAALLDRASTSPGEGMFAGSAPIRLLREVAELEHRGVALIQAHLQCTPIGQARVACA
jgi:hypothetical protein